MSRFRWTTVAVKPPGDTAVGLTFAALQQWISTSHLLLDRPSGVFGTLAPELITTGPVR
ncbi:hypothetical protein [Mycobacterium syngnathidarum]|uniref:hypothetical protein n=1 Tax=Mycobacterium syngnathidarum TaxID=1908205 RepID=UPI0013F4C006|nr:hypothetical protein [Mycobacterium syngnathidarum]